MREVSPFGMCWIGNWIGRALPHLASRRAALCPQRSLSPPRSSLAPFPLRPHSNIYLHHLIPSFIPLVSPASHRTTATTSLLNRPTTSSSRCSYTMIATMRISNTDLFRSPLQPRQPLPYPTLPDIPPSLEFDFPACSTSRFPISSIRPDAPQKSSADPPAHPPKPIYPRHDPLHILSQTPPPPPRSSPSVLPAPSVAPGVLADGVLTVKLPSVRQFLDAATIAPPECPPWPTDKRVLALVALSVFYHPLHPAHWALWNKEQKKATALMVQSVLGLFSLSLSAAPLVTLVPKILHLHLFFLRLDGSTFQRTSGSSRACRLLMALHSHLSLGTQHIPQPNLRTA